MLFSALVVAAAMLADTTPAAAQAAQAAPTPAPAAAAAPAPKTEKPRLICHTEAPIGSLMTKKVCYNADDAKEHQQDERQNLQALQAKSH